jgi:hypothetical protein
MNFAASILFCCVLFFAHGMHNNMDFEEGSSYDSEGDAISSKGTLPDMPGTDYKFKGANNPVSNLSLRRLVEHAWGKYKHFSKNRPGSPHNSRRPHIVPLKYAFCDMLLKIDNYELALNSLAIAVIEYKCQEANAANLSITKEQIARIFLSAFLQAHDEMYLYPARHQQTILERILKDHEVQDNYSMMEGALLNQDKTATDSWYRNDMERNIEERSNMGCE